MFEEFLKLFVSGKALANFQYAAETTGCLSTYSQLLNKHLVAEQAASMNDHMSRFIQL